MCERSSMCWSVSDWTSILTIDRHRILESQKKTKQKKHDVMCRPMELYDKNMKYVLSSPKTFFLIKLLNHLGI